MKMHQYDEALQDIKEAIKITPNDKKLREEFETIKKARTEYNKKQQKGFQQFFAEGIYQDKEVVLEKKEYNLPPFDENNPQVYMDIEIGEEGSEDHAK